MRVRLLFYCPHCSSLWFRPSQTRGIKDIFLRSFGVHAHRCQMCRLRFYLFKPYRLRSLLFLPPREVQPQLQPALQDGNRPLMAWELVRQNASDSRRKT